MNAQICRQQRARSADQTICGEGAVESTHATANRFKPKHRDFVQNVEYDEYLDSLCEHVVRPTNSHHISIAPANLGQCVWRYRSNVSLDVGAYTDSHHVKRPPRLLHRTHALHHGCACVADRSGAAGAA